MAPWSPLGHDGAGEPGGQLCVGGQAPGRQETGAQLQPRREGALHTHEVRKEGFPGTNLVHKHIIRFTPFQRHLSVSMTSAPIAGHNYEKS